MIIVHIIAGLNDGGAEGVLYRLCANDTKHTHIVISMIDEGKYGHLLQKVGIDVFCLNIKRGGIRVDDFFKLFKLLRRLKPNIVQTWMYHADLFGGFVARLAGFNKVFWNIRHSRLLPDDSKKSTIIVAKLCAFFSGIIPKGIVCCAEEAMRVHSNMGYKKRKMTVIANGYDTSLFKPDEKFKFQLRDELGIGPTELVLGMVGRFHPQKNHLGLLEALSIVKKSFSDFKFLLIGRNLNQNNQILVGKIKRYDLESNIFLLNQRSNIPAFMNSLDINILASKSGEGFPNVLAEAMSCGIPCVTTNVGDAQLIVANTGWVLPPNDPIALANIIIQAIEEFRCNQLLWLKRKNKCRDRIIQKFSLDIMINKYHIVWSI
jgi:glycosyltransferase involved in cell wall biosynthesis